MTGRIIDLSHPITAGMPVYPGDPPVRVEPAATVAADGVMVSALHLGTHTGTHVDAPRHVLEGATAVHAVPLDRLHGPARVVHVRHVRPRQRVLLGDVADQLARLGDAASGSGTPLRIVLFHTGWSRHFGSSRHFEHPSLDVAIALHLLGLGAAQHLLIMEKGTSGRRVEATCSMINREGAGGAAEGQACSLAGPATRPLSCSLPISASARPSSSASTSSVC